LFRVADPVFGDGFAGGAQPLFPFVGGWWLLVGVGQVVPAAGTAAVLCLEQAQGGAVQRWGWGVCGVAWSSSGSGPGRRVRGVPVTIWCRRILVQENLRR
jgi:hypothetical protein